MTRRRDPNFRLAQLKAEEVQIKQKIVIQRKKIRTDSRKRRAHQSRVLGECVARLADSGGLNDATLQQIMADLITHANENDRAALEGTPFEIAEAKPSRPPEHSFGLLRGRLPPTEDK